MNEQNKENVMYHGKIFEIVQQKKQMAGKEITFEIARRSPGTRLIIIKNNKMLITKELRREHDGYDYRLPGGKVFDTLNEYLESAKSGKDILESATNAAKKECLEETGLLTKNIELYQISKAGATIKWDLYYFIVNDFDEKQQALEDGEDITISWKTFDEVKELCFSNQINEDRTVGIILKYLNSRK